MHVVLNLMQLKVLEHNANKIISEINIDITVIILWLLLVYFDGLASRVICIDTLLPVDIGRNLNICISHYCQTYFNLVRKTVKTTLNIHVLL